MGTKTTKTELTEGFTLWRKDAHTVSTIEVQAIRIWADTTSRMLLEADAPPEERDRLRMLAGLLRAAAADDDATHVAALFLGKEHEAQQGRSPASIDPIPQ